LKILTKKQSISPLSLLSKSYTKYSDSMYEWLNPKGQSSQPILYNKRVRHGKIKSNDRHW